MFSQLHKVYHLRNLTLQHLRILINKIYHLLFFSYLKQIQEQRMKKKYLFISENGEPSWHDFSCLFFPLSFYHHQ